MSILHLLALLCTSLLTLLSVKHTMTQDHCVTLPITVAKELNMSMGIK